MRPRSRRFRASSPAEKISSLSTSLGVKCTRALTAILPSGRPFGFDFRERSVHGHSHRRDAHERGQRGIVPRSGPLVRVEQPSTVFHPTGERVRHQLIFTRRQGASSRGETTAGEAGGEAAGRPRNTTVPCRRRIANAFHDRHATVAPHPRYPRRTGAAGGAVKRRVGRREPAASGRARRTPSRAAPLSCRYCRVRRCRASCPRARTRAIRHDCRPAIFLRRRRCENLPAV